MRLILTLFCAVFYVYSAHSQTFIEDGDICFDSGDYACAVAKYDNAFKNASGRDRQIAEIKLGRAKWCAEHIKTANEAFSANNFIVAKDEYQKVLDSNPKDNYAQLQIVKCDNVLNLRKATTNDLNDIWNNKYGVKPQRRQNLIDAGIDPDDAQKRINAGEGKPPEKVKQATNLSVSKSTLFFNSSGGTSEQIEVYSDGTYSVPSGYLPSWCTVKTYKDYFTVTASENPNYKSRKNWFKVTADDKEVRINLEQYAKTNPQQSSRSEQQKSLGNPKNCFNCPKTNDTWGVNLGYLPQNNFIQFGLKAEPLFRYGFGLNTGINLLLDNGFDVIAVNIPLHLEYRLNFSRWVNIFAYGGIGLNAITDADSSTYPLPATFEYGGGFRINHIQFNFGKSLYLDNLRITQNLNFSVSYMF
jgi:hypothetical protein